MKSWKKKKSVSGTLDTGTNMPLSARAQAIKAGHLIDISRHAEEAEISSPVAMTAAAAKASGCLEHPAGSDEVLDRIGSVVYMLSLALKYTHGPSKSCFPVYIRDEKQMKKLNLKAVVLKDILYTRVITIMLPNESISY